MARSVSFDPESGRLRVTSGAFLGLAAAAAHGSPEPAAHDELCEAGVLVNGAIHRAVAPALVAVTAPSAQLSVAVMEDDACHVHQGWLAEVSGVLEDVGDDSYDLLTIDSESMPATLARLSRLCCRPLLPPGSITVSDDLLDALTSADDGARRRAAIAIAGAAPTGWADWARRVWAGDWRFTVVDVFWVNASGGLTDRRVAIVDTDAGLTLVDPSGPQLRLVPTTRRAVSELMVALLPQQGELSASTWSGESVADLA